MSETILVSLAGIALLGMGAQWLAWRLKLPSILFLLVFGFLAGPVTGLIDPDALFGDLLLPVVSISVAVILFEGGLTLRLEELREIGGVVLALVTLGAAVTWVVAAGAAHVVLGLEPKIAVLLGAVLVVTGPTVIGPLLRHIRPTGKVADILKWEGIDQCKGNPTNDNLRRLLRSIGIDIGPPGVDQEGQIFLTNVILCLKEGTLQAPVKEMWATRCGEKFLRPLIEIVEPRVVVALGERSFRAALGGGMCQRL